MKSLIKDNPIGMLLIGVCAVLGLLVLTQPLLLGRVDLAVDASADEDKFKVDVPVPDPDLKPVDEFSQVTGRHLFTQNRKPVPLEPGIDEPPIPEVEGPAGPFDAELAGIIITGDQKIAMLRHTQSKAILRAREGDAIEGDLAGWTVDKIEPRLVAFSSSAGETQELALEVHTKVQPRPKGARKAANKGGNKAGEKAANARPANAQQAEPLKAGDVVKPQDAYQQRAEEIRRRIAERREQLRQQAETQADKQPDDN